MGWKMERREYKSRGHNEEKRFEEKANHGQGLVARQMRLKAI